MHSPALRYRNIIRLVGSLCGKLLSRKSRIVVDIFTRGFSSSTDLCGILKSLTESTVVQFKKEPGNLIIAIVMVEGTDWVTLRKLALAKVGRVH